MRRVLVASCVAALAATLAGPALAAPGEGPPEGDLRPEEVGPPLGAGADEDAAVKATDPGVFIVRLADRPVAREPTARGPGGRARLDARWPAARAYRAQLARTRARVLGDVERELGRSVRPRHVYDYVLNGFAVWMTPAEAQAVAGLDGVVDVTPDELLELHTDAGPTWIGASELWDDGGDLATRGEGRRIGVVDTGINPSNPSFAGDDVVPPGGFLGACADDPAPCNAKLVGAYDFVSDGTQITDVHGHGSHVAGIAAGNEITATLDVPGSEPQDQQVSGVAPDAAIVSYRACHATGCPASALIAAINQAIEDEVDVLNYSIGGTSRDPWGDPAARALLDAHAAGVFVAVSAGNAGPEHGTVSSPADAPWVASVGAVTHQRTWLGLLVDFSGGDTTPPFFLIGRSFSEPMGDPAPIVLAADHDDPRCESPFASGTVSGRIVVCEAGGTSSRVVKGQHVAQGGAAGMVLVNDESRGDGLRADAHALPAVHLSHADATTLKAWLASGDDHAARIDSPHRFEGARDGVTAESSARGPNPQADVLTPSLAAPGVEILSAHGANDPQPPLWRMVSGTSMAAPHVAGAAALLRSLNPEWTPAMIQSALMLTAEPDLTKHDALTPSDALDVGAGAVRVAAAARTGLVMSETAERFEQADPKLGGDPSTLNLAAMVSTDCLGTCTWTRTLTSVAEGEVTWTVEVTEPNGVSVEVTSAEGAPFTLHPDDSVEVTVTADVHAAEPNTWTFGDVRLTADDPDVPDARLTLAIRPPGGVLPDIVEIDTRRDAGVVTVEGLRAMESPDLAVDVHGLAKATAIPGGVSQDQGDPYSPSTQVWTTTIDVPAGAVRLVAEIVASQGDDLDLFVGRGSTPSAATEVCRSRTPSWDERCDLDDPEAGPWWIMIQGWKTPAGGAAFELAVAAVPHAPNGTLTADAPPSAAAGVPFDVPLAWQADLAHGQRWYGALTLGSTPGAMGDIGRIPVDLVRHADDVTKTADRATAKPGDTITYELRIRPNLLPADAVYTIVDPIPDGLTYVQGSVSGNAAFDAAAGAIVFTGARPSPVSAGHAWAVTTNAGDPGCAVPFGDGTWVDLQALGISPHPSLDSASGSMWTAFQGGAPFSFYGQRHVGLALTDAGVVVFDPARNIDLQSEWREPQALPDPVKPNHLVAALWDDFRAVHEPGARGIRLATLGGTGSGAWAVVDYDGLELAEGGPGRWSAQAWIRRQPASGSPDVVLAYHDLGPLNRPVTIGVEDASGVHAATHVNQAPAEGALDADTVVCLRYLPAEDEVVTYQARVDATTSGPVTNRATHEIDDGRGPREVEATVQVEAQVTAVTVAPSSATMQPGSTRQFSAQATMSDGTTKSVTSPATWTTTNPSVVTVTGNGLATAQGPGQATLRASFGGRVGSATVTVPQPAAPPPPPPPAPLEPSEPDAPPDEVFRLFGPDRVNTAISISKDAFADHDAAELGSTARAGTERVRASAVVLARSTHFADALAGTPLAVAVGGPTLLTPAESLHPDVAAEITRVLAPGGTVYVLGGAAALAPAVETALTSLGYATVRLAGPTRIETSIAVAQLLDLDAVLLTAAENFPDALAAGAAGAATGAGVVLTTSDQPHPSVSAFLAAVPGADVYAVGGPAARAYPAATPLVGRTRESTAVAVAEAFFGQATHVGVARSDDYPDALAGGAHVGRHGGPLLLTPTNRLHDDVSAFLCARHADLHTGYVYGGQAAIHASTEDAVSSRIRGAGCTAP